MDGRSERRTPTHPSIQTLLIPGGAEDKNQEYLEARFHGHDKTRQSKASKTADASVPQCLKHQPQLQPQPSR